MKTDLLREIRSFMTCYCVCESWGTASIGRQGFVTADREQTQGVLQEVCDPSHAQSRQWPCSPICLSGAHLGGANDPKTHNSKKSAGTTSPLFIGLCFCSPPRLRSGCFHRSVNVIWDCESHRQRGSGVVGIKAERSDKSCPSALRCRREQQQVTSSAAYKQIFTRPMLSFGSRDMDIVS